jgi:hypothetical protein
MGQLLSAASLAVFSRSVAQLAGRSGSKMLRATAIAGGALASTSLAASGTAAAALTSERGRDDDQAKSLHRFLFSAGGPVHGGGLALLLGTLGLAGLRRGATPPLGDRCLCRRRGQCPGSTRARSAESCTSYPGREVP